MRIVAIYGNIRHHEWRIAAGRHTVCDVTVTTYSTLRPGAHWDAGEHRARQSRAGRRSTGNTAWQSVGSHWEVVSCNLAKWAMVEFIALSSESDSDEEMDTLMLLYLTSKRQNSVWKSEYMKKRKTHGEFTLTSEFSAKQFTNYFCLNRSQFNEVHRLVQNSIYSEGCNAQKPIGTEEKLAVFLRCFIFYVKLLTKT